MTGVKANASAGETRMYGCLLDEGIPAEVIECEWIFARPRRWRFDFAIPSRKIAIEVDGGIGWGMRSRHTEPGGFGRDAIKHSVAAAMGWRVFKSTGAPGHIRQIAAIVGKAYHRRKMSSEFLKSLK